MRVIIVDDEPLARRRIRSLLADVSDSEVVDECATGREAITAIRKHSPDVVFLDIQMPDGDGFRVAEEAGSSNGPAFIFVTAYDEHAVRAFEINALDYLLKPFDRKRFLSAWQRATDHVERGETLKAKSELASVLAKLQGEQIGEERLAIKEQGRIVFLPIKQIDWIESAGNYVTIHAGSAKHLLRDTMKNMEHRLGKQMFRRIHRNFIVNLGVIKEMHPWTADEGVLILHSGARLKVSRRYRRNLEDVT